MTKFNKKMTTYVVILVIMLSLIFPKVISNGGLESSIIYIALAMWTPGISAIITKLVFDRNIKNIGLKLCKFKYLLIAFFIPIISGLIVYSIAWITGMGDLDLSRYRFAGVLVVFINFVMSSILALGEEIGWRGFLVAELFEKFSYAKTSIISAVLWSVYHYPVLFFSDYNNGVSVAYSAIFFTISIVGVCFIASWLRLKSGSLWPIMVLHASHNYFVQGVFDVITVDKGNTKIFTTEFGIGLAVVYVLVGYYFYKRRDELVHNN